MDRVHCYGLRMDVRSSRVWCWSVADGPLGPILGFPVFTALMLVRAYGLGRFAGEWFGRFTGHYSLDECCRDLKRCFAFFDWLQSIGTRF